MNEFITSIPQQAQSEQQPQIQNSDYREELEEMQQQPQIQTVKQGEQFMDVVKDKFKVVKEQTTAFVEKNYKIIITCIIIIILAIIIHMIFRALSNPDSKKAENFIFETPNGPLSEETTIVPGKGAVSTVRYGGSVFVQDVQPSGVDMKSLIQNDASVAALRSGQQAEISLKKELYNGMKQQDDPEIEGNIQETPMMIMLQNQTNDMQIKKTINLQNSWEINNLDLSKQFNVARQIPLQDVNELEQMNREVQVNRDHNSMIQSAYGANISRAPNDPNEIIKNRQRYTTNSNRPDMDNVYGPKPEQIHEEIEYKIQFDNKKEAEVKLSGPSVQLPDMKPVEKTMETTQITQEPVVQIDNQKVVLSQSIIESPNVPGKLVVEKTVNPEIIAKVEEAYSRWPITLITPAQKEAAGQFMTVLVLLRQSGQEIPTFDVLVQKFPELQKMKPTGIFKGFDQHTVKWAVKQIEDVKNGNTSIDSIIAQFKSIYKVDPVQVTVVGKEQPDGSIKKEVTSLETTPTTEKTMESFTQHSNKRNFIVKKERYTVRPGYGIKGRQIVKTVYNVK